MEKQDGRREFFVIAGAGALLAACRNEEQKVQTEPMSNASAAPATTGEIEKPHKDDDAGEVTATEDLMREHGVIRRAIVVYREVALRLQSKAPNASFDALRKIAKIFRAFAEDYHERLLEEAYLFPAVKKAAGPAASLVDTLVAQHNRGREITDYVLTTSAAPRGSNDALVRVLEGFARMYDEHMAFEDTVVFPAWKKTMNAKELDEIGDRFEDIEHKTLGKDGFEDAVAQIAAIEKMIGLDLASMTPPPPP